MDGAVAAALASHPEIDAAEVAPTLDSLATSLGVSGSHLHRQFKRILGLSPKAYATAKRAERLQLGLRSGTSVAEAIYAAGFNTSRPHQTRPV